MPESKTPTTSKAAGKRVLSDHRQIGKKLIPPLLQQFSNFYETSWVRRMVPELLWIALLQEREVQRGINLSLALAKTASEVAPLTLPRWYGTASSFSGLTHDQGKSIRERLGSVGDLADMQRSLTFLVSCYPECPLRFLLAADIGEPATGELDLLRRVLVEMFDKRSSPATFVQATFIYLAFVLGGLKVVEGLALADFPKVVDYPSTERSKQVAAAVRSSVQLFFGPPAYDPASPWPGYFWNRGLELEPCTFEESRDDEG
jgi:hypothetical protein